MGTMSWPHGSPAPECGCAVTAGLLCVDSRKVGQTLREHRLTFVRG